MRKTSLVSAAVTLVCALLAVLPARAADVVPAPGFAIDEQGRALRVDFDPGTRAFFGAAATARSDGALSSAASFEMGFRYRHVVDFPEEKVAWKISHEIAEARADLGNAGDVRVSGALYRVRFLRWSLQSNIVLPTSPPVRVAFPFHIGFEGALGEIDGVMRAAPALPGAPRFDLGVARVSLLFDVWRRREVGSFAVFGFGPSYDLWVDSMPDMAAGGTKFEHVVAPFSRGFFAFQHESTDGRERVTARLEGAEAWSSQRGIFPWLRIQAGYEQIVLAINDRPLSLYGDVDYRWSELAPPGGSTHEFRATSGFRMSFAP